MTQDRQGRLWIALYGGGPKRAHDASNSSFSAVPDLPAMNVSALSADASGGVWIGTDKGTVYYWTEGVISEFQPNGNRRIRTLFSSRAGDLWIGTLGGLQQYSSNQLKQIPLKSGAR